MEGIDMDEEFKDIPISNIELNISVFLDDEKLRWTSGMSYNEALPLTVYGIWALQQGVPVGIYRFHNEQSDPPFQDCYPIMIATDQRSMWGRKCPHCAKYWRTGSLHLSSSVVCPYCGSHSEAYECLSDAQRIYVEACCDLFNKILAKQKEGQYKIKVRSLLQSAIVESLGETPIPDFFSEKARQTRFKCSFCEADNDILGRYGYCSCCGTRNEKAMHGIDTQHLREMLNNGGSPVTVLKEAVDGFDIVGRNIAYQLCNKVPMTMRRRSRWQKANFAQLNEVWSDLKRDFDIDIYYGISESDRNFAERMFNRRHIYTHKGGIVDQKYINATGDNVEVGQLLRETSQNVHKLLDKTTILVRNIVDGFHSIIPINEPPINAYRSFGA